MFKLTSPYGSLPIISFSMAEIYEPANDKGDKLMSVEDVVRQQAWLLATVYSRVNDQIFQLSQVQSLGDISKIMGALFTVVDTIKNYDTTPWVVQ